MSASLVGSEMCIRDRGAPRERQWQRARAALGVPLSVVPATARETCLLAPSAERAPPASNGRRPTTMKQ
eukprot:8749573-Alexandrium_andersonii.AAC.1